MENKIMNHIDTLVERYPMLSECKDEIISAYNILEEAYSDGRKLLVCGNGGSASDSEHIVGELMKEFRLKRKIYSAQIERLMKIDAEMGTVLADHLQGSLPAISLVGEPSLTTAFMNDAVPVLIFAQQVNGLGRAGDVFLGISTSGNSKNVLYAAVAAKSKGLKVIALTGKNENRLEAFADVCIHVPETETYKIQELHLPVYHCLCLMLEDKFFG
ncbi:D-sedoheptulose-7-phosphate isomerase [Prevotella sp.]|uniref:D-sedoheptulose-7-phosphate isomerase n=1 Tax=Prevotella sp. TaxID=59823 RepID=UPI0025CE1AFE|nr:SIS domain-containing protein [Prevotella sp.]